MSKEKSVQTKSAAPILAPPLQIAAFTAARNKTEVSFRFEVHNRLNPGVAQSGSWAIFQFGEAGWHSIATGRLSVKSATASALARSTTATSFKLIVRADGASTESTLEATTPRVQFVVVYSCGGVKLFDQGSRTQMRQQADSFIAACEKLGIETRRFIHDPSAWGRLSGSSYQVQVHYGFGGTKSRAFNTHAEAVNFQSQLVQLIGNRMNENRIDIR